MKMLLDSGDKETERLRKKLREKDRHLNSTLVEVDQLKLKIKKTEDEFELFKENCEMKFNRETEELKREFDTQVMRVKSTLDQLKSDKENLEKKLKKLRKHWKIKNQN